jgi:probable rRNA maturation factor
VLIEITGDGPACLRQAVSAVISTVGVKECHVAVSIVDENRMRELNRCYLAHDYATDVLSFPIDGLESTFGPRELGDIVICPQHTDDMVEAAVHGALHLCGYDHESDNGEMLGLQRRILSSLRCGES